MSTLIVGCGYLGRRVGAWLTRRDEPVHGTVRSARRAEELSAVGIAPTIADVLRPETLEELPEVRRVLYCVGFDRSAGPDMRTVYVDGLRYLLERLPATVTRVVYASSTSVYGQSDGEWVAEDAPTEPRSASGKVCLEAEGTLADWSPEGRHVSRVILRFSGLYGPGRIIRRALLERGEPIPGDSSRFLNLIHIDDAAQAAVAALDARRPDSLYLATDDRPVRRAEYYSVAARLLGAPAPRFGPSAEGPSRGDDTDRRFLNRRMRERLGVDLIFPDITSGLPAALGLGPSLP